MQRQMGQDTLLIVDGMNYIKGFRYQMYCAAREFKLRVCTVRPSLRTPRPFTALPPSLATRGLRLARIGILFDGGHDASG